MFFHIERNENLRRNRKTLLKIKCKLNFNIRKQINTIRIKTKIRWDIFAYLVIY